MKGSSFYNLSTHVVCLTYISPDFQQDIICHISGSFQYLEKIQTNTSTLSHSLSLKKRITDLATCLSGEMFLSTFL